MSRIARVLAVGALLAGGAALAVPAPAYAEPQPGTVTATFTDVCGFVRAEFTNADPVVAAQIHFSRNGRPFDGYDGFVGSAMTANLYELAADGDVIRFSWQVDGGATESVEHVHSRPGGCDEPRLALSLIDDCGPEFTVAITNSGTAPGEVVVSAPTIAFPTVTIPVGVTKYTVPAAAGSSARIWVKNPGGDTDFDLIADEVTRPLDCGIPWPPTATAYWTPACKQVTVVFFAVDYKGLLKVYRNGTVVAHESMDNDIHKWTIAVKAGDVVTILDGPPAATYVHHPPAGCIAAAASAPKPKSSHAAAHTGTSPAPSPSAIVVPAVLGPSPEAPEASDVPGPATIVERPARDSGIPVAFVTSGIALTLVVFGFGGWFLIGVLRRRRQPVWAVAFATRSPRPDIRNIGFVPTMSVRWIAHPGPATNTLREDWAS